MTSDVVSSRGSTEDVAMRRSKSPMEPAAESIAVVVVSCDRYADLWSPFFFLLDQFWPSRPGPVYLLSNHATPQFAGVETIAVGPDVSWSDNLALALERIPEEYVLLFLEDLLLCSAVDESRLQRIFGWVHQHRPNHVRLNPSERPYAPFDETVGLVPPGAPYRASTVLTLWKRDVLGAILNPGENAWEFEIRGSERSDPFDRFYSAHEKCFSVVNSVIRGKWEPAAVRRVGSLGAPVELRARPVMNPGEALHFALREARAKAFKVVPWKVRRTIRHILRPMD
jgi:hypothetical protein